MNVERRAFVRSFLARDPWCMARIPDCTKRAKDVHERLNRSQGGRIVGGSDDDYLALCRSCHRVITDNPKMAYERGVQRASVGVAAGPSSRRHRRDLTYEGDKSYQQAIGVTVAEIG